MKTASIGEARRFSLEGVEKVGLLDAGDLQVSLLCFEAGQRDEELVHHAGSVYQVLEGEALVNADGDRERLGKGKVLAVGAGVPHVLENAGGGLLVVLVTRAR
ncbi:MAG TPA: cupin domain-containing protein [Trueperaceae bacterium]